jgi:hypothetical protein
MTSRRTVFSTDDSEVGRWREMSTVILQTLNKH